MKRQRKKTTTFSSARNLSSRGEKKYSQKQTLTEHTQRIAKVSSNSKKKTRKKLNPHFKKLLRVLVMLAFIGIVVASGVLLGMYTAISREMKDMDISNLSLNYSSFVYSVDELGNAHEMEQLYDDGYRIWVESDEIADVVKEAVVAIEDERFYSHSGFDLKRTFGAFLGWTFEKLGGKKATYGGSTITQQVIKNITHEKERSSVRKIKEIMRAIALEKELSKDEILTLYLNIAFFSNNCYGIEAASEIYFDKSASELELTEAAMIVGITQRPTFYDPIRNPQNALDKRNLVLSKMNELDMISDEEYEEASEKDLGLSGKHNEKKSKIYSYFVDQVINDVINDLQTQKGYSETFAKQQIYNGGLKIYTTIDTNIQNALEEVFENDSNFPTSSAAKNAQSAMIIIDPYTGEVKGIVGGKGKKTTSRGLIRATQTKRQPGSSIKPLSVYAPSIELKKITSATILEDAKITVGSWSPQNAYSGFKGEIPLRKALEISSNTTSVRALQKLGIETSYSFLEDKFHITTLSNSDKALSPLALGGLTYGISLDELAAAYGVFANSGKYIKPYTYTKVIDSKGKLLLENKTEEKRSISEETSYIITSLLTSVVRGSSGTGKLARLSDMPVAGKTGTTDNNHDKWFVGYTPYYVGAVWYGFDTPASISKAGVNTNVSAKIWGQVMAKVHENLPRKEFSVPEKLVRKTICTKTGFLASESCSYAASEYFISGTQPSKPCGLNHSDPDASPAPSASSSASAVPSPDANSEPTAETIEIPSNTQPEQTPTLSPTKEPTPVAPQPEPDDEVVVIPE